jgi:hypothetical protein
MQWLIHVSGVEWPGCPLQQPTLVPDPSVQIVSVCMQMETTVLKENEDEARDIVYNVSDAVEDLINDYDHNGCGGGGEAGWLHFVHPLHAVSCWYCKKPSCIALL